MKKILFFVAAFIGMQVYYSCSSHSGESNAGVVSTAEMNISIDGMTCASGCAKTIEKTVSGLEGVTYSKVNFEEKTASFKYDGTKTDEKKILDAIAALNEGQYKVTKVEVKVQTKTDDANGNAIEAVEEKLAKDTAV